MSIIAAGTSSGTALVSTGDTNGTLVIQTNGTTVAATFGTDQKLTLAGALVTTGVSTFAAGSAAAPSITTTGDTNTGVFFPAADTIAFAEGGVEAVRIDSSGNVGIGTSSPVARNQIKGSGTSGQVTASWILENASSGTAGMDITGTAGASRWRFLYGPGPSTGTNTLTESMCILTEGASAGIVLVGATTARTTEAKLELRSAANTALSLYMFKDTQVEATLGFKSSTDSNFYVGSGSTSVGTNGVYLTNTGSSWNSVSDERMKTIVEPIENASAKVATLRAVIGYYNNDERQIRRPFLIAQDVQAVLPEAVNIQDVETGTLGMSYTDTIPLLVAAIKELKAEFDAYKAAHP